jgi:hypothetical protein
MTMQVAAEQFTADVDEYGDGLTVRLQGTADGGALDVLRALLPRVHWQAREMKVKQVAVDLRSLEFMNSSCFKTFVTWLSDVQELPADEQYRIRFQFDAKQFWLKRSLIALSCFAADLVDLVS